MENWIYLSPHFDDVALSCGGLVWEQARVNTNVAIWTICGGMPSGPLLSPFASSLHARWQSGENPVEARRMEDLAACERLGARPHHFSIPDCIYRKANGEFLYASESAIFGPLHSAENHLVEQLAEAFQKLLPAGVHLVAPLSLGNHVDHQLTHRAAELLGIPLWFYADYPYVLSSPAVEQMLASPYRQVFPISQAGLIAWQDAVAAHTSQIGTFWPSEAAMRQAIQAYAARHGGVSLWRYPPFPPHPASAPSNPKEPEN